MSRQHLQRNDNIDNDQSRIGDDGAHKLKTAVDDKPEEGCSC